MINASFETIYVRAGLESLTLVIPTNKMMKITDTISKIDWSNGGSFVKLEKVLLKCNGFIRE